MDPNSQMVDTLNAVELYEPLALSLFMAGQGDWGNFGFLGKFFKNLGRFFFWVIFYFSGQKNQKIDYFWADFYHRPALVF